MNRTTTLLSIVGIALSLLLFALWPARSDVGQDTAYPLEGQGMLDGLTFEGMFGPPDGSSDRSDILYFRDGRFWSKNCIPCGFLPGPYRAWKTSEGIRFEGILQSQNRGRFLYKGVVKDGQVYAHMNWRKERWYWTIDKDFRFEGVRAASPVAASLKQVTLIALSPTLEAEACRP